VIEIAGNGFHRRFSFLHQPAAATKILLHCPVQRGFAANTAGQRRDIVKLLYQRFNLRQSDITSRDNTLNAGGANHIGVAD